jgi:uncharacterized damage-inducible protein DinB
LAGWARIVSMNYYGAKEIASSFRTVRNNTIQVAEDIPEDQYDFQATPEVRTVRQMLIHISMLHRLALMLHRDHAHLKTLEGFNYLPLIAPLRDAEQEKRTKAQILEALRGGADEFEKFVPTLSDEFLGEVITMPKGGTPPARSRFDMLIAVKEHEMHHRAQLMLIQRMLGITPHLTRNMQARMAVLQVAQAAKGV